MKHHRTIINRSDYYWWLSLRPSPRALWPSPLLSGYGGPGQGNQAILGSTLLGGPAADRGGRLGRRTGAASSPRRGPAPSAAPARRLPSTAGASARSSSRGASGAKAGGRGRRARRTRSGSRPPASRSIFSPAAGIAAGRRRPRRRWASPAGISRTSCWRSARWSSRRTSHQTARRRTPAARRMGRLKGCARRTRVIK